MATRLIPLLSSTEFHVLLRGKKKNLFLISFLQNIGLSLRTCRNFESVSGGADRGGFFFSFFLSFPEKFYRVEILVRSS